MYINLIKIAQKARNYKFIYYISVINFSCVYKIIFLI